MSEESESKAGVRVFVTKWALTQGISTVDGAEIRGNGFCVFEQSGFPRMVFLARGSYALSMEAAFVQVRAQIASKQKSLDKAMRKLASQQEMLTAGTFPVVAWKQKPEES